MTDIPAINSYTLTELIGSETIRDLVCAYANACSGDIRIQDLKGVSVLELCGRDNDSSKPFFRAQVEVERELLGTVEWRPRQDETSAKALQHAVMLARVLSAAAFTAYKSKLAAFMHSASVEAVNHELASANSRMEELLRVATESSRLKSAFLATVSHELKTPLTSVLGYAEMLKDGVAGKMTETQTEYAGIIHGKGLQLERLINKILELARLEAGTSVLSIKSSGLASLVSMAIEKYSADADLKRVVLENRVPIDLPDLDCDREKIREALGCLVDNAVKFSPAGGRVVVEAAAEEGVRSDEGGRFGGEPEPFIAVSVSDSGKGIEKQAVGRIFDPFYQIEESQTREHAGMGVGLKLAKGFTELHGGRIDVVSEPGKGARFTLHLPVKQEA
ncbi:MAG: HAMP domain-containing sensor histidine kinase [Myxococcota bacterium]|jgi:signal transduction histidine kinase